uniref:Cadherin domain-containing protein n=1 Tax=Coturnix japonica TaxID=93934 RepID=A0A8C2YB41_COTJA
GISNSLMTFKILENSEPGLHFPVEASETAKFIELVLEKSLDREKQPEMDLNLIAIDGGSPPRTGSTQIHIVVLDANDNAPVFTQKVYSGHVFENAPEGSAVLKVVANDADEGVNGDISYQFSQSAEHSLFTVNSRTGEIIIEKPLDFETTKKHEFTVQAIDGGGLSSMCNVIVEVIDVNDNAPEIVVSSFNSPLLENVAPGTVVTLFAVRDQDSGVNGEITCALEEQLSFSLKQAFKNYYELVTVSALDREETAQHIVVVTAADAGSPSLTTTHTFTVDVSDVNDNAPVFNQTSYTMYVRENNVPAIDPENEYFSVAFHAHSGSDNVLELVLQQPLDREEMPEMDFNLIATDGGSPRRSSSTQIHIIVLDANDNAPIFTQKNYIVHVLENTPEGSVALRVVASDADEGLNGDISYQFSQAVGQSHTSFMIEPSSGEIRITKPLDFEVAQKHELSVRAVDGGGLSALCKVLVEVMDVNDNAPEIVVSSFSSSVPENSRFLFVCFVLYSLKPVLKFLNQNLNNSSVCSAVQSTLCGISIP